ncbi:MAG TPA: ABC transporter ATP-binding protein, partial [Mesorhizobium sp.]|nr:ABC transporter ATP-binding protein [Mesorhizobium sp.]
LEGNAGRVVIMNEGRKIADGTLDELRHIARLPTKIRLKTAEGGAQRLREWMGEPAGLRQINGHIVEIDATPEDKAAFLRRAAGEGAPFVDLDMVPPGLDELYAHFLAGRAAR